MVFIRDTEQSLKAAVYLVNTLPGHDDEDTLSTIADFEAYLAVNPYTGAIRRDERDLRELCRRGRWPPSRSSPTISTAIKRR